MKKLLLILLVMLMLVCSSSLISSEEVKATTQVIVNDTELSLNGDGWYYSQDRKGELNMPNLEVHNNDVHCNNIIGTSLEYTLTGSSIKILGEKNTDHGKAKVDIYRSGESTPFYTEEIDFYDTYRHGKEELFYKQLEKDTYRVVISVLENKWIVVDALVYDVEKSYVVEGITDIEVDNSTPSGNYTIINNGAGTYVPGETVSVNISCDNKPHYADILTLMNGEQVLESKIIKASGNIEFTFQSSNENMQLRLLARSVNKLYFGDLIWVNDNKFTYNDGNWYYSENRKAEMGMPLLEAFDGDVHCDNRQGSWAEYEFTGGDVTLYGELSPSHGRATVSLYRKSDNQLIANEEISFYDDTRTGKVPLFYKSLAYDEYRIRITLLENKWIVLDALSFLDSTNLVQGLQVEPASITSTTEINGNYRVIIDGAANPISEGEQVIITLFNNVAMTESDRVQVMDGDKVLDSTFVDSKGTVLLSFLMPAHNVTPTINIEGGHLVPAEYWVQDAFHKIYSNETVPQEPRKELELDMAKNEYESVQVALRDIKPFTIEGIQFSNLVHSNGVDQLSEEHLSYYFVDYTAIAPVNPNVKGPVVEDGSNGNIPAAYRPERIYPKDTTTTIIPDPLSNDITRQVDAGFTQPIYMTMYVPAETVPGTYVSQVIIETSRGDITLPLTIQVYDVEIPDIKDSSYTVYNWDSAVSYSFQFTLDSPKMYYDLDDRYTTEWWNLIDHWTDSMIDHRQNMYLLNTPQLLIDGGTTISQDGTVNFNWSKFDEFITKLIDKGFTQFGGMRLIFHWDGINPLSYGGGKRGKTGILERNGADDNLVFRGYYIDDERSQRFFEQYISELAIHLDSLYVDEEAGITVFDRWYQHVFDEPKYAINGGADWKAVAELIKEYAVIKDEQGNVIKRLKTSDADASGILKANESLVDRFVPDLKDYANDKAYYDNLIEQGRDVAFYVCVSPNPPYLNRFISQDTLTSVLLSWYAEKNNLSLLLHWGFNTWSYSGRTPEGDAQIVYPDKENMMLKSSLRYEAMRDGIEDYELLQILRGIDESLAEEIIGRVLTDANTYNTDTTNYRQVRKDLLDAID